MQAHHANLTPPLRLQPLQKTPPLIFRHLPLPPVSFEI
jgi:hypothetical protein